jgi:hypothetical protein
MPSVRSWTSLGSAADRATRQRAAGATPGDIHLEQPVLRVHVTLHEVQVVVVAGLDMRDAVDIAREPADRVPAH